MNPAETSKDPAMERLLERAGRDWTTDSAPVPAAFVAGVLDRLESGATPEPLPSARVLAMPSRRWIGLAAVAAVLLVIASYGLFQASRPAFGGVAWRTGDVAAAERFSSGSVLAVGADGGAVALLDGGRIALCMSSDSHLTVDSRARVRLDRGEAWFDVKTNSGRFEVAVPEGSVVVTGTSFGVRVDEDGRGRVLLAEGGVRLVIGGEEVALKPGQEGVWGPHGGPAVTAWEDARRPEWADSMRRQAARDAAARHYPSGNLRGQKDEHAP